MEKTYGTVTPATIRALQGIVGDKGVIFDDAEKLQPYGFDILALLHQKGHPPEAAVKPQTTEQVSEIMKLATRETIPVTPRGAGSGLAGAAVPTHGGISLSLERMNRILEVDRVDRVAVVEPGVVTNELCRRVAEEGLMYAGYPMSTETSFIGGNLHSGLFKPDGVSVEAWPDKAEEIFDEMSRIALEMGGAGSGEHGVGTLKRSLFLKTRTETELALLRGIKQVFDPKSILNPGTMI